MGSARSAVYSAYANFSKIDGRHPFRDAVPDGYVDYEVRTRHGGDVFYFNFDLAKEIGLIPKSHPHEINHDLKEVLLHTFSLQIVNEYDILHETPIPKKDIRPHKYMATRYLQLQHPSKKGYTSGDGRSMWNGYFSGRNGTWDFSSCGTGSTCLSPAAAIEKRPFKTGDPKASYGSGRSDLLDGVCAALMSEVLYRNNIPTERTLVVIGFDDGTSINVRASKNLLRPAHFFMHLKQNQYAPLKAAIDFYIDRQVTNGEWRRVRDERRKYQEMLNHIAKAFAKVTARFEVEYIFCWMAWDGDNILTDGGVIDYGSVRQFGLFHHEYRYDDVDRMSTTITEQKRHAKYIVQTFAQIVDFLLTGKKNNIHTFRNDPALALFEEVYQADKDKHILYKVGYDNDEIAYLLNHKPSRELFGQFKKVFAYFERAKSSKGLYEVQDGITWDAIFCVRDILRELPTYYLEGVERISAKEFIEIIKSNYATKADLEVTPNRYKNIMKFQKLYRQLVSCVAEFRRREEGHILRNIIQRSAIINRYDRVTGDAIIYAAELLIEGRLHMTSKTLHQMFYEFVNHQIHCPEYLEKNKIPIEPLTSRNALAVLDSMYEVVSDYREGI